jgi:predicted nuclease of restriction endonuclease-like (RecB) superfamily
LRADQPTGDREAVTGQKLKKTGSHLPEGYTAFLADIKRRVQTAQVRVAVSANQELISLYWDIGRAIHKKQSQQGWGARIIDLLAADLRREFPEIKGFSRANIYRMRAFYLAWRDESAIVAQVVRQSAHQFVPQAVRQLPWGHNVILLEKVEDQSDRLWYARAAIACGWSRSVLALQIETRLHERQGQAITNFATTLPAPQSDLAQQTLKDPYLFDFLTLDAAARERELELGLLDHIQKFLVELGVGFAFVGRQYRVDVSGEEFSLDLLFYHLRLRCFVVVDLKMEAFKPEFAGKMNFYLSAVDDQLRHRDDQPTIGLLLCKEKDRLIVEYALRDVKKPIGVAEWRTRLAKSLPKELQSNLPTIAQIEAELADGLRAGETQRATKETRKKY